MENKKNLEEKLKDLNKKIDNLCKCKRESRLLKFKKGGRIYDFLNIGFYSLLMISFVMFTGFASVVFLFPIIIMIHRFTKEEYYAGSIKNIGMEKKDSKGEEVIYYVDYYNDENNEITKTDYFNVVSSSFFTNLILTSIAILTHFVTSILLLLPFESIIAKAPENVFTSLPYIVSYILATLLFLLFIYVADNDVFKFNVENKHLKSKKELKIMKEEIISDLENVKGDIKENSTELERLIFLKDKVKHLNLESNKLSEVIQLDIEKELKKNGLHNINSFFLKKTTLKEGDLVNE